MKSKNGFNIKRYAFQSFRYYGGKSMIFMIVLAVTLILALFNISTSLQGTVYKQAVTIGGDAQFKYPDVAPEQIEILKNQKQVEWISEYVYFANMWVSMPDQTVGEKSAGLVCIENLEQMDGFKLTSGVNPEKENEIAIPPYVAEYLGIEAKAGVEFEIMLTTAEFGNLSPEIIEKPVKFIVSGIIQDNSFFKSTERYYVFVSEQFVYANTETDNRDVFVKLKKGYEAGKVSNEIAKIIGFDESKIEYNNFYLLASGNNIGDRIVFYVIIALFIFVGALIIYNAFNIIIAKRTRHFGLLTLIGASKKQIRMCVYIESLLNIASALPVGLLLGTFMGWVVMPIVRASYAKASSVYSISPWSYLLTVMATVIMVFAGVLIPAKRAGKIPPVEAAKFNPDNIKRKKIKSIKNINLLSLARINLFRKKGGAGGMVASLSIVGVLFVSVSFVLFSVYDSLGNLARQSMAADIEVRWGIEDGRFIYYGGQMSEILPEDVVGKIINLDGVKDSLVFYIQNYAPPDDETAYFSGSIIGADDEVMRETLKYTVNKERDLKLNDFKENKINVIAVSDPYYSYLRDGREEYHLGQDITVNLGNHFFNEGSTRQITLHIAGIVDRRDMPPYNFGTSIDYQVLIMPKSSFEANNFTLLCDSIFLDIDGLKYKSVAASLDKICEDEGNIHYKSFMNEKKQYENQMMSILVLVMAALGIIFLVSVINLISTTFIGIEQRKKEIGVLSALGLGCREVKKMLRWEGVWVSMFSSIISITGGFAAGWLVYIWIKNIGAEYIELSFPVLPLTIFCFIYILTPFIITSISVRKLLKNTTVELLGQEF